VACVRCVAAVGNDLGEGPWWDAAGGVLWWVDAWRATLWRHRPHDGTTWSTALPPALASEPLGSLVLDAQGRPVCALRRGFWRLDLARGDAVILADVADVADVAAVAEAAGDPPPTNRLNDGKCDRAGRYWCGSLNTDWTQATGALYRLDAARELQCVVRRHGIGNGIAFSPDDRRLYFADTRARVVWQYDFDLDAGTIGNRRLFIGPDALPGQPDGATVDAEGCYWSAQFGAGSVARFDPHGRRMRTIALPTRDPTMCTFGGPGLATLYVTTARRFLDPAQREAQPLAGALLALDEPGARGLAEPRFGG
jgi:sugar lactone lactonase YvrE